MTSKKVPRPAFCAVEHSSPVPGTNGRVRETTCRHLVDGIWIPAGFRWDGASIPRWLWSVFGSPFIGVHSESAKVHDIYTRYQGIVPRSIGPVRSMSEAHREFRLGTRKRCDNGWQVIGAWLMWLAVVLCGWVAWRKGVPCLARYEAIRWGLPSDPDPCDVACDGNGCALRERR